MISAIKGMNDLFGEKAFRWGKMEEDIKEMMAAADFGEFRTPILEEIALFKRGVGETTDVVKKEMYDFLDKKGRHVAMRPEGTASVVRAFVEHGIGINYPSPFKAFYIAPFFRYERPQKGRFRQFHQFGVEIFGDETPQMDAEMIFTASRVLEHFGIDYEIHLNSIGCKECRAAYREKLIEYFSAKKENLCEDCRTRLEANPLRLLDCKACDPKANCADVPKMTDYLCEDCKNHFEELQKALHAFGVPFVLDPFIVRGLDYYTKTAFEIVAKTGGSQNAVAGGGRVKPDVVLYEEGLNQNIISESVRAISEAEVLIIGGTSLAVYPAAGLIDYFSGDKLVVINMAPTPRDKFADLLISAPIGQVFDAVKVK